MPDEANNSEQQQDNLMKGAIAETDYGNQILFDINPDSFTDSKETEFAEISIPGMSHPKLQFTGGNARTLSFTVYLHHGVTEDVPSAIRYLQSWLYAEYEDGKLSEPPAKLLIVFGDTWPDELWLLKSCNITRKRFDKFLNCIFAQADLQFVQFIDDSTDTRDLRE